MSSTPPSPEPLGGYRIHRLLIVAAALIFLMIPLTTTFNELLTAIVKAAGLNQLLYPLVTGEVAIVASLLRTLGLQAGASPSQIWIGGSFIPITAYINWNCAGWQSLVLFGVTGVQGLKETSRWRRRVMILGIGVLGTFLVNVLRILLVILMAYYVGYLPAVIFHDYAGTIMVLVWLFAFWHLAFKHFLKS